MTDRSTLDVAERSKGSHDNSFAGKSACCGDRERPGGGSGGSGRECCGDPERERDGCEPAVEYDCWRVWMSAPSSVTSRVLPLRTATTVSSPSVFIPINDPPTDHNDKNSLIFGVIFLYFDSFVCSRVKEGEKRERRGREEGERRSGVQIVIRR